jgi:hypothetical protein
LLLQVPLSIAKRDGEADLVGEVSHQAKMLISVLTVELVLLFLTHTQIIGLVFGEQTHES